MFLQTDTWTNRLRLWHWFNQLDAEQEPKSVTSCWLCLTAKVSLTVGSFPVLTNGSNQEVSNSPIFDKYEQEELSMSQAVSFHQPSRAEHLLWLTGLLSPGEKCPMASTHGEQCILFRWQLPFKSFTIQRYIRDNCARIQLCWCAPLVLLTIIVFSILQRRKIPLNE